jgi:hypothetical protein
MALGSRPRRRRHGGRSGGFPGHDRFKSPPAPHVHESVAVIREPLPYPFQVEEVFVEQEPSGAEHAIDLGERLRDATKIVMRGAGVVNRNESENDVIRRLGKGEVQYIRLTEDDGGGPARREMTVKCSLCRLELSRVQVRRDVLRWLKTFYETSCELSAATTNFEADGGGRNRRARSYSSERSSGAAPC